MQKFQSKKQNIEDTGKAVQNIPEDHMGFQKEIFLKLSAKKLRNFEM